jgi:hypothetical protein
VAHFVGHFILHRGVRGGMPGVHRSWFRDGFDWRDSQRASRVDVPWRIDGLAHVPWYLLTRAVVAARAHRGLDRGQGRPRLVVHDGCRARREVHVSPFDPGSLASCFSTPRTLSGDSSPPTSTVTVFMRFLARNTLLAGYPNRYLEVLRATVLTKINR